jgi:developmental checkpoint coupling sporulation initiation to replication initiation
LQFKNSPFRKENLKVELSDELLLDSYNKALKLKLSSDFIELLKKEMDRRNLAFRSQTMHGNEDARTIMDTYTRSL